MPSSPSEFVPPFISPLTHDQHAQLGRIAILWGQIDMILDQLLQFAIGLTGQQRITLIGEKPLGAKLSMLTVHLDDIKHKEAQKAAREFWNLANETKTARNRCFHGVWGFRCGKKKNDIFAAAMHFKAKENPVRADQLAPLEKKLCRTARVGWKAVAALSEFSADDRCGRLYHGPSLKSPPWLQEWREQHPVDDHSLDHRHKAGELPYLTKPL